MSVAFGQEGMLMAKDKQLEHESILAQSNPRDCDGVLQSVRLRRVSSLLSSGSIPQEDDQDDAHHEPAQPTQPGIQREAPSTSVAAARM